MEAKGGETDPVFMVNCFIKKRLTLEYAFYKLTNNVMFFFIIFGELMGFYVNLMVLKDLKLTFFEKVCN